MVVICDTTTPNYLLQLGLIEILPRRFGSIILPTSVLKEMSDRRAPEVVRAWTTALPSWIQVRAPSTVRTMLQLGAGEVECISLAVELQADCVLLDDLAARDEAKRLRLATVGTLGIRRGRSSKGMAELRSATGAATRLKLSSQPSGYRSSPPDTLVMESSGSGRLSAGVR
jgi:predicted nucleic acid-binding protein